MRRIHTTLLLVVILVGLTISCSEELKPTPYEFPRNFSGANSKTWKVKLFEQIVNGKLVDRFLPGCLQDDRFKFSSDHLFLTTSGNAKCFEDEADATTSTWSFVGSTATLTMPFPLFGDGPIPFFVRKVATKDFEVELFFGDDQSESYRIQFDLVDEE